MSQISLEESIRSYPLYKLKEVIDDAKNDYSEEAKDIAKDELILREVKGLDTLEQIDYIKNLDSKAKFYILTKSFKVYPQHVLNIIRKDNSFQGIEHPEWYYLDNTIPKGPYNFNELKKLADYDAILSTTLVFRQSDQNMVPAINIPGLIDISTRHQVPIIPTIQNQYASQIIQQPDNKQQEQGASLGCGLSLVSFLVPVVGIILYFTEKNQKGQNALALSLVGLILSIIMYFTFGEF
jgi:hypothetical protein